MEARHENECVEMEGNKENMVSGTPAGKDAGKDLDKEMSRKEKLLVWKETQKRKAESTPSDRPNKVPKTPLPATPRAKATAPAAHHGTPALQSREYKNFVANVSAAGARTPLPRAQTQWTALREQKAASSEKSSEKVAAVRQVGSTNAGGSAKGRPDPTAQRKQERQLLRYLGNHLDNPHSMFGTPPKQQQALTQTKPAGVHSKQSEQGSTAAAPALSEDSPASIVAVQAESTLPGVTVCKATAITGEAVVPHAEHSAPIEIASQPRSQESDSSSSSGSAGSGPLDELHEGYAKMAETLRDIAIEVGAPTDPVKAADSIKSWVFSLITALREEVEQVRFENAELRLIAETVEQQKKLTEDAENLAKYFSMMYKLATDSSSQQAPPVPHSSTPFGTPRHVSTLAPRDATPNPSFGNSDPIALARSLTEGITDAPDAPEDDDRMDVNTDPLEQTQLFAFLADEEEAGRDSIGGGSPSRALNRTITIDRRESGGRASFFSSSDEIIVPARNSACATVVRNTGIQTDDFVGRVLRAAKVAVGECDRLRFSNEILLQTMDEMRGKIEGAERAAADKMLMLENRHKEEIMEWQELLQSTVQDMNTNLHSGLRASVEKNKAMQARLEQANEKVVLLENTLRSLGHTLPYELGAVPMSVDGGDSPR
eukprot:Opistho-2@65171